MIRRSSHTFDALSIVALAMVLVGSPEPTQGQPARPVRTAGADAPPVSRGYMSDAADGGVTAVASAPRAPGLAATVRAALDRYRATGVASAVTFGTVTALPFGHAEPVVTCTVLRACVVELEAGERMADAPVAGDPVRWSIDSAKAGPGGATVLVLVKPRACDVTTNLLVPTDRRIYDLTLDSPPCPRRSLNPRLPVTRHVRFYYPDDDRMVAPSVATPAARVVSRDSAPSPAGPLTAVVEAALAAGREVNREYRVVRKRRGPFGLLGHRRVDFPWEPAGIVDDGARTFVILPAGAAPHAAPVLYAIEDDGSRTMVNYAVRSLGGGQVYVADRVMRRATLVMMAGSRERRLELENRGWGRVSRGPHTVPDTVAGARLDR